MLVIRRLVVGRVECDLFCDLDVVGIYMVDAFAVCRNLDSAPRKLNLVADLVRGRLASEAVHRLAFSKKRAASIMLKVLKSAMANAQNNHDLDLDVLYVNEVLVSKSRVLYRMRPRAMGKAYRIRKFYSVVKISLREGA